MNKAGIKYCIISSADLAYLVSEFDKFANMGYRPLGGISTAVFPGDPPHVVFSQAMIRENDA